MRLEEFPSFDTPSVSPSTNPNLEELLHSSNSLGPSTSTLGLEGCSDAIEDCSDPQAYTPTQGPQPQELACGEEVSTISMFCVYMPVHDWFNVLIMLLLYM
jgi:hypothetical protein